MKFKEGTKCEECKKIIPDRKAWVQYRGKIFCNWTCEGKYERVHQNDRVERDEVEKSLSVSKRMKIKKEKRKRSKFEW